MAATDGGIRVIRERHIITHKSSHERDIEKEFTIYNDTNESVKTIFLYSDLFMPGLKVLDAQQRELVLYSNEDTRRYLSAEDDQQAGILLKQMNTHQLYVLWIRFPDDSIMKPGEPKIIKFIYHDNTTPPNKGGFDLLRQQRFLFSIPQFEDSYHKIAGQRYDVFYIVKAPENDNIDCEILNISHRNGLHENYYRNSLSLRFPPVNDELSFRVSYEVMPDVNERHFFGVAIFSLIILSAIFTLIGLQVINSEWLWLLKPIDKNLDTLFGGIVTVSIAAIGFINKPIMIRTRFWFIVPIVVSGIGFLLN